MKTPSPLAKLCGLLATAVMIAGLSCASAEAKHQNTEESPTPCSGYLPVGTRIRIEAIEPTEWPDELIGEVELLLPLSTILCKGEQGKRTGYFSSLCTNGQINQGEKDRTFDVLFSFRRLTKEDIEESLFFCLFKELSARAGDKAVAIFVKNNAVSWDLWFRGPNEMVSKCFVDIPGSSLRRSFYMVWQREK